MLSKRSIRCVPSIPRIRPSRVAGNGGNQRLTYNTEDNQTIDHFITYSVIASTPALTYSSVISTIRCYAVTSGPNEGSTFVQWSGNFSSDADAGILLSL